MRYKQSILGIYFPVFIAMIIIPTILRTIAVFIDYNEKTAYFENGILTIISGITVLVGALFFLTYISRTRKGMRLLPNFTNAATYIPSGICGVAFVFAALFFIILFFNEAAAMLKIIRATASPSTSSYSKYLIRTFFYFALSILGALSAANFAITALAESRTNSRRATLGLATVLYLSLYAAYLFFSDKLPLNAPNKAIDQMSALFLSLFFLYEVRISLGREKWRGYIACGMIAGMLSAYSSIPSLIIYITRGVEISDNIYESLLTFTLFIYVTARIILTTCLSDKKESSIVTNLKESAASRAATLQASQIQDEEPLEESAEGVVHETQISIEIDELSIQKSSDEQAEEPEGEQLTDSQPQEYNQN